MWIRSVYFRGILFLVISVNFNPLCTIDAEKQFWLREKMNKIENMVRMFTFEGWMFVCWFQNRKSKMI